MQVADGEGWPPPDLRSLDQLLQAVKDAEGRQELDALRLTLINVISDLIDHEEMGKSAERLRTPAIRGTTGSVKSHDVPRREPWTSRIGRLRWGGLKNAEFDGLSDRLSIINKRSNDAEEIVAVFVSLLDKNTYPTSFHDQRKLSRSKEEIIVAISQCLRDENSEHYTDMLRSYAYRLTFYQKGIGRRPLHVGGMRLESYDPRPGRQQFSSAITADPRRARLYNDCLRRQANDLRNFSAYFGVEARSSSDARSDSFYLNGKE